MSRGRGPKALAGGLAGDLNGDLAGPLPDSHAGVGSDGRSDVLPVAARLRQWRILFARQVAEWLAAEEAARRLFLWLPVFFGAGLLLYFAADREPALWAPMTGLCLFVIAAWRARRRGAIALWRTTAALAFLFAGFAAGTLQTWWVAAPVLERTLITRATAFVETVEMRLRPGRDGKAPQIGARLLLRPLTMQRTPRAGMPERVRVTMRWRPDFEAGATIAATMRLLPPPRPSEPGGYDFARDAYFQKIGAVGHLLSQPRIAAGNAANVSWGARLNAWIDRGRNALTERIARVIGGADGAVAAALVTGKRGLIPEQANEDLRAAGIYHVVSISGLHMVLAAGLFVWGLRAFLALFPSVLLTRPVKMWAALFAMAGAIAYCLFSGSEVATERALIMTLVMLGAMVIGRPAISMRNLAIAALLVMALRPNSLLGPSFQMSFAAVAAMIAAFERRAGAPEPWEAGSDDPARDARQDPFWRVRMIVMAMIVTTLVASLATDPYALYHFHRITPYGLIGNTLVLPLVEFVVMPAAVIGVVASAFGLDGPVWWLMGQGVGLMMDVARWVASLSGSTIYLPAFGPAALLCMTFGLIWIALWQTPLRWLGLGFSALGVALAATPERHDLLIDARGRTVAVRNAAGKLDVLNARANRFAVGQWLTSDADGRKPDGDLAGQGRCDREGCTIRMKDGRLLALVLRRSALASDCARADIVIMGYEARDLCRGPEKIYDRLHLRAWGATQVRLARDGLLPMRTARHPDYDRPWSPAPSRRAGAKRTRTAPAGGWKAPSAGRSAGSSKPAEGGPGGWFVPSTAE